MDASGLIWVIFLLLLVLYISIGVIDKRERKQ